MLTPGLPHFLIVGAVLFAFGTYTVVTRTNAVGILMGVELLLNAANINFVGVIVLAAAEAAVALAIVLAIYLNTKTIDVTEADTLRE